MNEIWASLIVAIVQGMSEWLPVSSSGHLVLAERLLGFSGGLDFDVALHFGTLMAVFVYFGKDVVDILRDVVLGRWRTESGKLGMMVLLASVPAAIVGFFFREVFEIVFNDLWIVAASFCVSGMFLLVASFSPRKDSELGAKSAFLIGVAQVFALFPGISRSGSTFGAGLLAGLNEKNALKFSFLMSIPIIFGANVLTIGNETLPPSMIWATLVSFVVGLATIHLLYRKILTNRRNLKWFGIYALVLGVVLFLLLI